MYTFIANRLSNLMRNNSGATAIEYAIIAGGISIAILAGVTTLGGSVTAMWTLVKNALSG